MMFRSFITLATFLFLLIPATQGGLFSGFPLNPYELVIAGIWLILVWTLPWQKIPGSKVLILVVFALLSILKVSTAAALPYGVSVCLKPALTDPTTLPCESSVRHHDGKTTLVESHVGYDRDDWPLYFMNDTRRFNFFGPEKVNRENLPYFLSAEGYVNSPEDHIIAVTTSISDVTVNINNSRYMLTPHQTATMVLPRNSTHFKLSYTRSAHQPTDYLDIATSAPVWTTPVKAGATTGLWFYRIAQVILFGAILFPLLIATIRYLAELRPDWPRLGIMTLLTALGFILPLALPLFGLFLIGVIAAMLGNGTTRKFLPLGTLALFLLTVAFVTHNLSPHAMVFFLGGTDELGHEYYARTTFLATTIRDYFTAAEAYPYYYQPLARYIFGGLHVLTGEAMWGPYIIQTFVLTLGITLTAATLRRYTSHLVMSIFLVLSLLFLINPQLSLLAITITPYQQAIALPLLLLVLPWGFLLFMERGPKPLPVFFFGLVWGAILMTRTDFVPLLVMPFGLFIYWWWKNRPSVRKLALIGGVFLLGLAIFPAIVIVRNSMIGGKALLFPTSTVVNILPTFRPTIDKTENAGLTITGGKALIIVLREYAHNPGDLVNTLFINIYRGFIGIEFLRVALWFSTPILVIMAFLVRHTTARIILLVCLAGFVCLVVLNAFFELHNGVSMRAPFDYLLIIMAAISLGIVIPALLRSSYTPAKRITK